MIGNISNNFTLSLKIGVANSINLFRERVNAPLNHHLSYNVKKIIRLFEKVR